MNKLFLISFLLPLTVLSQTNSCQQFDKIIDFFKTDTTFNNYYKDVSIKFDITDSVGTGGIYPFMEYKYIAGKLGFDNERDVFKYNRDTLNAMYKRIEEEELADTSNKTHVPCLNKHHTNKKATIYLNFYQKDLKTVAVYTGRIYKKPRHTYGMMHLFFFNEEDEIRQVFNSTWIE